MASYKKSNVFEAGFSFLELMIVMSIIMLLSTLTYSSYLNTSERAKLKAEANELTLTLEKAKKHAQAGYRACETFSGTYEVVIESGGYELVPGGCSALYDYELPSALALQTTDQAIFNADGISSTTACIILEHTRMNTCRKITLEGTGTISNTEDADCECP